MKNLKEDVHLNTVNTIDKTKVWIPQVVFSNTEQKAESLIDEKAYITVARNGPFETSKSEDLHNTHVFTGNSII